jgi:Ala-tRNA(Pro) deacylase
MEHGVRYETRTHPEAFTTGEVAEAEHVPGKSMAKAVMLMAGERLVMAVIPGNRMLDLDKARETLRVEEIRLAEEREFAPLFPDCEPGAEPPFGALYDVPTLVDLTLDGPRITFSAGTHTDTITMDLGDYLELTHPQRSDVVR